MFDLAELERAHKIVGAAVPPTPAHAWPLLAQRLGTSVVVKHENHTAPSRCAAGSPILIACGASRRMCRASSRRRAAITARVWRLPRAAPAFRRRSMCPMATRSRRTAPCTPSAPNWLSTARIFRRRARKPAARPSAPVCTWCRRFTATSCWALRPTRSNCSARRRISTCSMCRSGRARASAAASWRAICSA
ncbi:hypothetical protein ES703_108652 [subsurface metagenome]